MLPQNEIDLLGIGQNRVLSDTIIEYRNDPIALSALERGSIPILNVPKQLDDLSGACGCAASWRRFSDVLQYMAVPNRLVWIDRCDKLTRKRRLKGTQCVVEMQ